MSDDLEKLFADAVADAPPQKTEISPEITTEMDCMKCSHGKTHKICPTCSGSFCEDCASILDPTYCKQCLNEPMAELQQLPLKDADGVTHEGRVLIPKGSFYQPRFGTLAKSVSEMSDYELEAHVQQFKELVKQGETALDFRRVVLGSMQMEVAQRGDAKRRSLRADKTKYAVRTVAIGKDGQKKVSTASMSQMLDMLKALDLMQQAKAKAKQEKSPNATS